MVQRFLAATAVILGCASCSTISPAKSTRPNIVLIIADDIAWDDIGPEGNPKVQAPNIDRLAAEGMWCDRAFLTIASCSPSRSSIISGRYPHNTDAEQLHWPLPGSTPTFVDALRKAGYWTAAAGKWHLGSEIKEHFDVVHEADVSGYQIPPGSKGGFAHTMKGEIASGCDQWLPTLESRPKDKPFFLWLASLDAHRPYYPGIIPKPHTLSDVALPPYLVDIPEIRQDFALYYDEITRFDGYLGRVMDELEKQGVADNTLLLFISDNGRPFPRDKVTLYDSGIKTPFYLRWPAKVQKGSKTSSLISSIDIAPTLLDVAGVTPQRSFVGKSFLPILQNPAATTRSYAFAEKHWHDYDDQIRAVTNGRFKYLRNYYTEFPNTPSADGVRSPVFQKMLELKKAGTLPSHQMGFFTHPRPAEELYDCEADQYELKNLADDPAHAGVLATMRAQLADWRARTGDKLPTKRTLDEFDRLTGIATDARVRPRRSKAQMIKEGMLGR
ncbi:MAG: N-sulfoglucosamine sulfohydrolase [Rhodothermales bacterium]|jgi:N-sulfoglucosamine sulfohydrolase